MKKLKLFTILSLVISILLILTTLIPMAKYRGSSNINQIAGLSILLGFGNHIGADGEISFAGNASILLIIAYLLPIIFAILLMVFKNRGNAIGYVFGGLLIAAFIFESLMLFNLTSVASCTLNGTTMTLKQADIRASVGAYIGGVGALLGAVSSIAYVCFKYLLSKKDN